MLSKSGYLSKATEPETSEAQVQIQAFDLHATQWDVAGRAPAGFLGGVIIGLLHKMGAGWD